MLALEAVDTVDAADSITDGVPEPSHEIYNILNDPIEDEDFDPQAFFASVLQSDNNYRGSPSEPLKNANGSDLNNDLLLSESEESDQEFNMNEFLKQDST